MYAIYKWCLVSSKMPDWVDVCFTEVAECLDAWPIVEQYFRDINPLIVTGLRCTFKQI